MEVYLLILVAIVNLIINIFGAISGGKGLIFRPILLFLGIPIQSVISNLIVSATGTRFIRIYSFQKFKKIDWKLAKFF